MNHQILNSHVNNGAVIPVYMLIMKRRWLVFTTDKLPFFKSFKCYYSVMVLVFECCFWGTECCFCWAITNSFVKLKFLQMHKIHQVIPNFYYGLSKFWERRVSALAVSKSLTEHALKGRADSFSCGALLSELRGQRAENIHAFGGLPVKGEGNC